MMPPVRLELLTCPSQADDSARITDVCHIGNQA